MWMATATWIPQRQPATSPNWQILSGLDAGDLDAQIALAMALLASLALASLVHEHVELLATDLFQDFGRDGRAGNVGSADVRSVSRPRLTDHHHLVEGQLPAAVLLLALSLLGLAFSRQQINVQHIAFSDPDLRTAVFDNGVHGRISCKKEPGSLAGPERAAKSM